MEDGIHIYIWPLNMIYNECRPTASSGDKCTASGGDECTASGGDECTARIPGINENDLHCRPKLNSRLTSTMIKFRSCVVITRLQPNPHDSCSHVSTALYITCPTALVSWRSQTSGAATLVCDLCCRFSTAFNQGLCF